MTGPGHAQSGWPFDTSDEAVRLRSEAIALSDKQRYAEALPLIRKSVSLEREIYGEQDARSLTGLRQLAFTYYKLARYQDALSVDERRLRVSVKALGDKHPDSIAALRDVAVAYQNVYDDGYARSLPLLEKALRLRTEVLGDRHADTLSVMTDVANAYGFTGRASEALALYEQQLRITTAAFGNKDERTQNALRVVASAYSDMGREAEAAAIFEKLLEVESAKGGDHRRETAFNLVRLAGSYNRLQRYTEALSLMQRAMQLRKEVFAAKDREAIHFIELLAATYTHLGREQDALPLFSEALKLNTQDGGERSFVTLRSMNALARCLELLGRLQEAEALHKRVLQLRIQVQGAQHADTIVSLVNLARVERQLGNMSEARTLYEKAVPAIEALRTNGDLSPENRQALFAQWVGAYKAYSGLLIAAGQAAEAFRIAELSKARTLLESTVMRRANQFTALDANERSRVEGLERRIARLNDAIAAAAEQPQQRLVLEAEKNQVIAQFAAYRRELGKKYPKYAQLNEVKILGSEAGQALLTDDTLLVSYLLDGDRLMAFTLSAHDLQARLLDDVPGLAQTIEAYRRVISDPRGAAGLQLAGDRVWRLRDGSYFVARSQPAPDSALVQDTEEIGRYLGDKLLEPLVQQLAGWKQLIVAADDALTVLPFEALPVAGKLLIADHDVRYIQSLSMLALLKSRDDDYRRLGDRKDLFAMGNPIYQAGAAEPASGKAPQKKGEMDAGIVVGKMVSLNPGDPRGIQRAFDLLQLKWPNLPGTEREISNVAHLFGAAQTTVFTRHEATEAKLLQLNNQHALSKYRYLLFSAHGYLSVEEPALSALVLGQIDKAPGTDGYVTASEWPSYDLRSDLVVLSACETGLGKIIQGEGVIGLPYALYVAGNKNTLLSLWPVVDASTAEFMTAFFSKLKAGATQSAALNDTKRDFITEGHFRQPVYWAPFVLYGY